MPRPVRKQKRSTFLGGPLEHCAQRVSHRRDAHQRNQRVRHDEKVRWTEQEARPMQNEKERCCGSERRRIHAIEQVVSSNQHDAEDAGDDRRPFRTNTASGVDHRPSERPEDDQQRHPKVDVELPGEAAQDSASTQISQIPRVTRNRASAGGIALCGGEKDRLRCQ